MNVTRRVVPWLGRLVLLASIVIFALIGVRYLADPAGALATFHTALGSPAGATSARVGFGAFPLAFALILAVCLFSSRRRLFGLGMVATIMGMATGARLLGLALDGPAPESSVLLVPEVTLLALSSFCAAVEWRARADASALEPAEEERGLSGDGPETGRLRRRVGAGMIVGLAVVLAASALVKLAGVPAVVTELGSLGFARLLPLVGILELASAALLAFALTRPVGLLMASAFLGGAVATTLQHGLSPVPPAVTLALVWLAAWLRHPDWARGGIGGHRRVVAAIEAQPPIRERASA